MARYVVGIDLGTTHTVVASVDATLAREGTAPPLEVFAIDQLTARGEVGALELLPSTRYHASTAELLESQAALPWGEAPKNEDGSLVVVGALARELGARVPGRLIASAKSWLSHAAVDRSAAILPWGAPDEVAKVSPVEASASYLGHLRQAWDHHHPKHLLADQDVVLTVPASFDEGARALTMRAAREAGLKVRLIEEPQAAFYDYLARHTEDLEARLEDVKLALVCDVGGGTTDLSLIRVELRDTGPRLTRIAVGEHLMLGGDNMDLALAHLVEPRLTGGNAQLGAARHAQLVEQCRAAKERLLASDAPPTTRVTVLGEGSRLIGGSKSAELARDEAHAAIVEGFFPKVGLDAFPDKRKSGLVSLGLPYVADAAITKHLASFLTTHAAAAREALGIEDGTSIAIPDALLLNGGVFRAPALASRIAEVLGAWKGKPLVALDNDAPELAVARGAAAYGLARRGIGLRIGGGSPRSYYVRIDDAPPEEGGHKRGVCLLPHGADEGEEIVLRSRTFSLRLGRPVRFSLSASTTDRAHKPGDIVPLEGEGYVELPPIAAVLEAKDSDPSKKGQEVPVRLIAALTEVGTIEVSSVDVADEHRRWKLELQLRGSGQEQANVATTVVTQLHPRFAEATARIARIYGKSEQAVEPRDVKTTRAELEKILGARETWDTPLLRELFSALFAGVKHRRRSADHERVWLNLTGYALRPGLGYPLDEWRVRELSKIFEQSVQFVPEAQVWAEWWTLWRRVSGGLDAKTQGRILDAIEFYLQPPSPRPRKAPPGPRMLGYDDMVRLAGSLERVEASRKALVGGWLIERLTRHGEGAQSWWAVGRLGGRVPFYGSAHTVVSRETATAWAREILKLDLRAVEPAAFALAQLARASGDRERDLELSLREEIAKRLEAASAPKTWAAMVREVQHLDAADERRVFGESLPPGLRFIE